MRFARCQIAALCLEVYRKVVPGRFADDEGIAPEAITYGETEGTLYAPLTTIGGVSVAAFVIADLPDGTKHVLQTEEVDVGTVKSIAAGMRPVSP